MEVTETRADGLQRELQVVVPAATLDERLNAHLAELSHKVQLKGFRPGKVPMSHLRKMYGRSAMAEVINTVMSESIKGAVEEREEKPAMQPDVDIEQDAVEDVMAGKQDLAFAVKYEVLPRIEVSGLSEIEVERPVVSVSDEEVDAEVAKIAESNREYSPVTRPAQDGDRVKVDFIGRIGGEAFDGGTAEDLDITLGSGNFIPGFEEQLTGAEPGETRVVTVNFPEDYPAEALAGQEAVFDVTVKDVAAPTEPTVDDGLAERLGLSDLEALKSAVREEMEKAYQKATRARVKRALLDALDERFRFDLPQSLVDSEFETIWKQMCADMERQGQAFDPEAGDDDELSETKARKDYQAIAERRVRLGLLLSEIGTQAEVEVTDDEVQKALGEQMRQYPGHERELIQYYRENPEAVASLRAPIFEDKVVDYVLEFVNVTDKPVSKDELLGDPDTDPDD